jgi:hypothetical protein
MDEVYSTEDIGSIGLPARDGEGLGYSRTHDSSIGIWHDFVSVRDPKIGFARSSL